MLNIERNAPCPCGSGKKYKKCCALAPSGGKTLPDNIMHQRAIAYRGTIGAQREDFCRKYTAMKRSAIAEVENDLRQEVAKSQQNITCSRGCYHCCCAYILASLQECEAIVYYLYQHETALQHFLESYKTWKNQISHMSQIFQNVGILQEKVMSGKIRDDQKDVFYANLELYMQRKVPCPFISNSACSIYEVRPFVCAGVISTSPQEWCEPFHANHPQVMLYKAELNLENDAPYFMPLINNITYACAPMLVHAILQNGYATLATMPGLEKLKALAAKQPIK